MAQPVIQTSFASGEWAPKLRSRVDLQKYKTGLALMRNFYVDYSGGGASTRTGSEYVLQTLQSPVNPSLGNTNAVRLISFQPSTAVSYVLEFGNQYIRFHSNGAPILENPAGAGITAATNANPGVFTNVGQHYHNGQWIFITNVTAAGFIALQNQYFIVQNVSGSTFTLTTLTGVPVDTTLFGAWSGTAITRRVYTLTSPYSVNDLFPNPITGNPGLKFVQDVTTLIITHPSYPIYNLGIASPASWFIYSPGIGPSIDQPGGLAISTNLGAGTWSYALTVTAVDINGQESTAQAPVVLGASFLSLQSTAGYVRLTWNAVNGAASYNVYKASPVSGLTISTSAPVGFIGNTTDTAFNDPSPGFAPDFGQTPPLFNDPFSGTGVTSYTVTAAGTYTSVPTVFVDAPGGSGSQAVGQAVLGVVSFTGGTGGTGYVPNQIYNIIDGSNVTWATFQVLTVGGGGSITTGQIAFQGNITSGATPANPLHISGPGTNAAITLTWGVIAVNAIFEGSGYDSVPNVNFSSGAAAAFANLGDSNSANPSVPAFFQERLCLAAQLQAPQGINLSQPGQFFNFDFSFPSEDSDAISTSIISGELNDIRSMTGVPTGLIALSGKAAWLINGGGGLSTSDPITPSNITASPQAFNGANDLNPLKINLDILYSTNKGSYVRDLAYNIYANVFTGADVSVLSNHLFFGHYLIQWDWSEEPFKNVWAVRNDGVLLSLAFVKEQELIGWAHHDTDGKYVSTCSVIETLPSGNVVDAVYVVVQRFINGNYVQYIERMADRYFNYGAEDAWCVDAGLQTNPAISNSSPLYANGASAAAVGNTLTLQDTVNSPFTAGMVGWVIRFGGGIYTITGFNSSSSVTAQVTRVPSSIDPYTGEPTPYDGIGYTIWQPLTTVIGLTHLIGKSVTGLADGVVVPSTVVSATGSVTLSTSATKVTLGLPYLPQLQTLPLDTGEPTIQSKRKKVPAATMRVADTLGLQVGTTFPNAVPVKDFQLGAIPSQSNGPALVTDLYTGDGRIVLDQVWQEIGQLCVQQNLPYPATILGIMPELTIGDTSK